MQLLNLKKWMALIEQALTTLTTTTSYDWEDFTYSDGFKEYTQNTLDRNMPRAEKRGKIVNLTGAIITTKAQTTTGEKIMGYVPDACKPLRHQTLIQQGSGQEKYLLMINPDGSMVASRYGATTDTPLPNGIWLNITCTYISAS